MLHILAVRKSPRLFSLSSIIKVAIIIEVLLINLLKFVQGLHPVIFFDIYLICNKQSNL